MTGVRRRILVVEEDASNRGLLMLLLDRSGYAVCTVAELATAITLCEGARFDLVLADSFSLTREDALTATNDLRRAAGCTPVILLTAHAVDTRDACAAGIAAIIRKPFDVDELVRELEGVLSSSLVS